MNESIGTGYQCLSVRETSCICLRNQQKILINLLRFAAVGDFVDAIFKMGDTPRSPGTDTQSVQLATSKQTPSLQLDWAWQTRSKWQQAEMLAQKTNAGCTSPLSIWWRFIQERFLETIHLTEATPYPKFPPFSAATGSKSWYEHCLPFPKTVYQNGAEPPYFNIQDKSLFLHNRGPPVMVFQSLSTILLHRAGPARTACLSLGPMLRDARVPKLLELESERMLRCNACIQKTEHWDMRLGLPR